MEISFTNGWRTVFPDGARNSRWASCGGSMNGYAGHRASMGDLCRHAAKNELRKAGETSCAANDDVGSHPQLPVGREPRYLTLGLIRKIRLRARQLLNNKAEVQKAAHS